MSEQMKWPGLKIECAGRCVRLDTTGDVFFDEDGAVIKQEKAAWWPEGIFRILVAPSRNGGTKQWLLFFKLEEGESYFESLECMDEADKFLYPDFLISINRRLEVMPICGEDERNRMCSGFSSIDQMNSRYGVRCFAETVKYAGENCLSINRMAYFDADTKEFVLVDCLNMKIQRRSMDIRVDVDSLVYRFDALAYDAGDYYVAMKVGAVNKGGDRPVELVDAFGAHSFERFTRAFYEYDGDLASSAFYDTHVPPTERN